MYLEQKSQTQQEAAVLTFQVSAFDIYWQLATHNTLTFWVIYLVQYVYSGQLIYMELYIKVYNREC